MAQISTTFPDLGPLNNTANALVWTAGTNQTSQYQIVAPGGGNQIEAASVAGPGPVGAAASIATFGEAQVAWVKVGQVPGAGDDNDNFGPAIKVRGAAAQQSYGLAIRTPQSGSWRLHRDAGGPVYTVASNITLQVDDWIGLQFFPNTPGAAQGTVRLWHVRAGVKVQVGVDYVDNSPLLVASGAVYDRVGFNSGWGGGQVRYSEFRGGDTADVVDPTAGGGAVSFGAADSRRRLINQLMAF
jgi:hypothetical protein